MRRVDDAVGKLIDAAINETNDPALKTELEKLRGKIAVAQAMLSYRILETIFLGVELDDSYGVIEREIGGKLMKEIEWARGEFSNLSKNHGANVQRLLLASTGTKPEQIYDHLHYAILLGPYMHFTLPEGTLEWLSQFVKGLNDEEVAALRRRSIIKEGIPELVLTMETKKGRAWVDAILADKGKVSPDRILLNLYRWVLQPKGETLDSIGNDLRDGGDESFRKDEQATIKLIKTRIEEREIANSENITLIAI
jgi:hypothetical protein